MSESRWLTGLLQGIRICFVLSILWLTVILYTGEAVHDGMGLLSSVNLAAMAVCAAAIILLGLLVRLRSQCSLRTQAGLLLCCLVIVYLSNFHSVVYGDTLAARYLPFSILIERDFDLDEFPEISTGNVGEVRDAGRFGAPVYRVSGRIVSAYPVGAPLLAIPFYVLPALGRAPQEGFLARSLEKLAAAAITAASVVMMFLVLTLITSRSRSILLAVIYGLGTSCWSVSSQALFQHGPGQLSLLAAIWCLFKGRENSRWIGAAGFPAAFAVVCRPMNVLLALPLFVYVLIHHRRQCLAFMAFAVPPAVFQGMYNYVYYGAPLHTQWDVAKASLWSTPLFEGLSGLLFSPARGLFIYSPVLLFSAPGMLKIWIDRNRHLLRYLSLGVLATILLYSKYFMWWGGYTYGPRLLSDITPLLILFLSQWEALFNKGWLRVAFLSLAIFSGMAHAIGAYKPSPNWSQRKNVDNHPRRLWLWTDNPLVNPPRKWILRAGILLGMQSATRSDQYGIESGIELARPAPVEVELGSRLRLRVVARNTSADIAWMSEAPEREGAVVLRWKWFQRSRPVSGMQGNVRLPQDVYPGASQEFALKLDAPPVPGKYALRIGMAFALKKGFAGPLLILPIEVRRPHPK